MVDFVLNIFAAILFILLGIYMFLCLYRQFRDPVDSWQQTNAHVLEGKNVYGVETKYGTAYHHEQAIEYWAAGKLYRRFIAVNEWDRMEGADIKIKYNPDRPGQFIVINELDETQGRRSWPLIILFGIAGILFFTIGIFIICISD